MRFGPSNASSIDLCIRDLVAFSKYKETTQIICSENDTLFEDLDIRTYSRAVDSSKWRKIRFARDLVAKTAPDLVVVQQHLPTAAALASQLRTPVILHKHNMTKAIAAKNFAGRVRKHWRLREYRSLAGMIFVSEACRRDFQRDFPEVQTSSAIVYNGLNFDEWRPAATKENEIICVGRAAPEKGIKEAAVAMAEVLSGHPSWRGRFILSEPQAFPDYLQDVMSTLEGVSGQVTVQFNQVYSEVRRCYREAAIASKWAEPFGRTALEAHAAGCSVISASSGGLPEINADNALLLPPDFTSADISRHLDTLVRDESLRSSLAQKGREYCQERFSLSLISASADAFYETIVGERALASRPGGLPRQTPPHPNPRSV
jgi:glycosyltransferase involved in cell wall biosynthesis